MSAIIETSDLTKHFGGLSALQDISLQVQSNTIHGLIGPNGAGKTTLLNVISGIYRPTTGKVCFDGGDVTHLRPDQIHARGVARTFQNIRLFRQMQVIENVMVGLYAGSHLGLLPTVFRPAWTQMMESKLRQYAMEALSFVGLTELSGESVHRLSYGQQRLLELARAIVSKPRGLLLDEPAAGLSHQESSDLAARIRRLREQGMTIILVEHRMSFVMSLCQRISVLNFGRLIANGTPSEIQQNEQVIEAYLGTAHVPT